MDVDAILAAYAMDEAEKAAIAKSSPYAGGLSVTNQLDDVILKAAANPQYSTKDVILAGFLNGLVGGGLNTLDEGYRSDARKEYTDAITAGKTGREIERDYLSPSVFDSATEKGQLLRLKSIWDDQKAEADYNRKIREARELRGINTEADWELKERELKLTKPWIFDEEPTTQATSMIQSEGGREREADWTFPPLAEQVSPGGENTLEQKVRAGLRTGEFESPADGYKYFRELEASQSADLAKQYEDIGEAGQRGSQLIDLANGLESALSRVGNTGLTGNAGQFADKVMGTVFEAPERRAAAGEELEQYNPEIIKLARPSGVGAMSDPEMRVYLQSGASLSKTEEANQAVVDRLRYAGNIDQVYALYMDENRKEGVPRAEADAKWTRLRAQNPYLTRGEDGTLSQNPFWTRAANELLGVEEPEVSASGQATPATSANTPYSHDSLVAQGYVFDQQAGGYVRAR